MICLDFNPALASSAGIELYTKEVAKKLLTGNLAQKALLLCENKEMAVSILQKEGIADTGKIILNKTREKFLRYSWAFANTPDIKNISGQNIKLVHHPNTIYIPNKKGKSIITVHDIFRISQSKYVNFKSKLSLYEQVERTSIRKANHIIAISQYTKNDLLNHFAVKEENISVVYNGVHHHEFFPYNDDMLISGAKKRYHIPDGDYLLYTGSLYKRKIGNLLEGYHLALKKTELPVLVISGGRHEIDIRKHIAALKLEKNVIITGFIQQEDLPILMSGCMAFVYLSFFEGFGISVLEAMACGAPVLVANNSSLPEVVGPAGKCVNPFNIEEISEEIIHLVQSEDVRKQMKDASIKQAALFSWDKCAAEVINIYKRLL